MVGVRIWLGRAVEEVCGGASPYVVAWHSRSGLSFQVSLTPSLYRPLAFFSFAVGKSY